MSGAAHSQTNLTLQEQIALLESQLSALPPANQQAAQEALNNLRAALAEPEQLLSEAQDLRAKNESLQILLQQAQVDQQVLSSLMALAPEGLAYIDAHTKKVIYISQWGQEMLHFNPAHPPTASNLSELFAQWTLYREDGKTQLNRDEIPLVRTLKTGEVIENMEIVIEHQDGERIPLLVDSVPVYSTTKELAFVLLTWQDISRIKHTQEALQRSENRNRDVLAAIADCYYHLDTNWRIVEINDAALDYFNRPREFFLGKRIWDLSPLGIDSLFEDEYLRAVHKQRPVHFESPSRLVDRWAEVFAYPDETGLSIYFRDISVRKLTEQALRDANQKLKSVLNSITEAFFVLDRSWRVVEYNRLAEQQMFHRPPEERVGRVFWDLYPEAVGSEFYRQYHRSFATGRPVHFEAYSVIASRWYEVHAYPRDQVLEIYLHDINERKQSEERLNFQARLLENTQDAIIATDANFLIEFWNRAAEELYGWRSEEAVGKNLYQIIPVNLSEDELARLQKSLRTRPTFRNTLVHKTRDGRSIYVEAAGVVLRDSQGKITGYAASHRDVTAQKKSEEDLRRSRQRITDILNSISDGFFALDRDWKFIYANQAIAKQYQLDPETLIGKYIWDEFPDLKHTEIEEACRRVMEDREPQHIEGSRESNWFNVSIHPSTEGISVYMMNITEQVHVRQELERSEERVREIIEGISDGFFSVNQDWRFTFVNPVFARDMHQTVEKMVGQNIWGMFPNLIGTPADKAFRLVMKQREPIVVLQQHGQTGRWLELRIHPSSDGISVFSLDKTESKEIELERERLLEENRRQRELLERLISSAPVGIAVLEGPEHRVMLANQIMEQISHGKGEIIGKPVGEIWPEVQHLFIPHLDKVYQTGELFNVTDLPMPVDRGQGPEDAYFSFSYTPLRNEQGEIDSILVLLTETSESVKARREQERQQNLMQTMVENLPVGVWIADEKGQITFANKAGQQIWAGAAFVAPDEYQVYKAWWADTGELLKPEEWGVARAVQKGETSLDEVLEIETFDGTHKIIRNSAVPVRDEQQKLIGAVVVNEDITERRRAEEALRSSEAKVRRLVDSNLIGILFGSRGGIIEANNAFLDMLGYTREEMVNGHLNWRDLTPPEFLERDEKASQESLERGVCTPYEKEYIHKDGHRVPVLIGYALLTGSIHEYVCFVIDLADRKRVEHNARFLARLSQRLFSTTDADQRAHLASNLLGRYLRAQRAFFVDIQSKTGDMIVAPDYHKGKPSLVGVQHLPDVLAALKNELEKNRVLVIKDLSVDPRFSGLYEAYLSQEGIRSAIFIPRMVEGEWASSFVVASDHPREWRDEEIALVQSAADVIWLSIRNARLIQRLRETRERFNVALKHSPIVVYTCDRDLRFTWVYNPPAGLKAENMIGKTDLELLEPQSAAILMELKQSVLDSGIGLRKEVAFDLEGKKVIYDTTLEPLRNENDEMIGLTVSSVEVTEQRRLESEMHEQQMHAEIHRRIMEQRERERIEIARELHDGPLQEMIAINFGLEEALAIQEKEQRLKKISFLQDAIQRQIRELREFCSELRPPALAPFGLEKAIQSHADTFRAKYPGITLHLDLMKDGQSLDEDLRLSLYRIYQELIYNVVRHSSARQVTVRLWLDESEVTLVVEDDGQGFAMPLEWVEMARQGHMGLVGVRERAESLGGNVRVISAPGIGTTVLVIVPRQQ